jgi:hypothetical protein
MTVLAKRFTTKLTNVPFVVKDARSTVVYVVALRLGTDSVCHRLPA